MSNARRSTGATVSEDALAAPETTRTSLSAESQATACAEGQAMALPEAIEYTLAERD
jgi:hypothetical protein